MCFHFCVFILTSTSGRESIWFLVRVNTQIDYFATGHTNKLGNKVYLSSVELMICTSHRCCAIIVPLWWSCKYPLRLESKQSIPFLLKKIKKYLPQLLFSLIIPMAHDNMNYSWRVYMFWYCHSFIIKKQGLNVY